MVYKLRIRFSRDMQFLQNYIAIYEASLKAQKVMLPPFKCHIFCFRSKFVLLTQLSRQQIKFSKIWLFHFLVYMAKYPQKNYKYPLSRSWEICVTDRQTDRRTDRQTERQVNRQTDRQTDRQTVRWTDGQDWFYRTLSAKMELWSCFSEIWE